MKKPFAVALLLVAIVGIAALLTTSPVYAAKGSCANVRCASCPDGYHWLMQWPTCCACVKN
jgi:hypothetical protein